MLPSPDPVTAGARAVVVGSGPNGLAAAVVLARAGLQVEVYEGATEPGGATRSEDGLLGPGTVVDLGSAAHPLGVSSPLFRALDLTRHGLTWAHPPVPAAHPLPGRPAVLLHADLAGTAEQLGRDGAAWRRLHEPLVEHWDELVEAVLAPVLRRPRHPLTLARFGTRAALPATVLARAAFRTEAARALFAGSAAHAAMPLNRPLTSAFGLVLGTAAHARGWPVAQGGSRAIAAALVAELQAYGGTVRTGTPVTDLRQVGGCDLVLLDTAPGQALSLLADQVPRRVRWALGRWRHGPGAFKVDYLLDGPVPWADDRVTGAGTVHLGGTLDRIARAEAQVVAGTHPDQPYVLVVQPGAADPGRAPAGRHILWTYAHTVHGSTRDMRPAIEAQLERAAPGFRDRVLEARVSTPAQLQAWNPNLVGGDVTGGPGTGLQQVLRPRPTVWPYALGVPGVFLCSSSTPPGGGVHGMCGYHAATAALHWLRRRRTGRR